MLSIRGATITSRKIKNDLSEGVRRANYLIVVLGILVIIGNNLEDYLNLSPLGLSLLALGFFLLENQIIGPYMKKNKYRLSLQVCIFLIAMSIFIFLISGQNVSTNNKIKYGDAH